LFSVITAEKFAARSVNHSGAERGYCTSVGVKVQTED
jgi:hypothetical protein